MRFNVFFFMLASVMTLPVYGVPVPQGFTGFLAKALVAPLAGSRNSGNSPSDHVAQAMARPLAGSRATGPSDTVVKALVKPVVAGNRDDARAQPEHPPAGGHQKRFVKRALRSM